LWLFNIFQTLPGVLLATQTGLDANDHAELTFVTATRPAAGAQGAAQAAGWENVIGHAMEVLADGLRGLMDAGLPAPDEVGYELEQAGEVIAEAELVWSTRKLVLLMPELEEYKSIWEAQGWKAVVGQGDWPQVMRNELGNSGTKPRSPEEEQT
jgi:DEAD/DEAH box helicase domain-containing protein